MAAWATVAVAGGGTGGGRRGEVAVAGIGS